MTEQLSTNAAESIAAELRNEVIDKFTDGQHLGSAEELAARFGVSVTTLRQGLRVLEAEGLVRVRRGNSGGYFASTPSARVVSRSASALLQRQGVRFRDLLGCAQLLAPEMAALAAASTDADQRHALADEIEGLWSGQADTDVGVALRASTELGLRLGELCGNKALALFLAVLTDLVVDLQAHVLQSAPIEGVNKMTARVAEGQLMLADAVRNGDVVFARQAMHVINAGLTL